MFLKLGPVGSELACSLEGLPFESRFSQKKIDHFLLFVQVFKPQSLERIEKWVSDLV
jgi:hypothetical protein